MKRRQLLLHSVSFVAAGVLGVSLFGSRRFEKAEQQNITELPGQPAAFEIHYFRIEAPTRLVGGKNVINGMIGGVDLHQPGDYIAQYLGQDVGWLVQG